MPEWLLIALVWNPALRAVSVAHQFLIISWHPSIGGATLSRCTPLDVEKGDRTMSQEPKVGDRVCLTTRDFEPDYQRGEEGTVLSGPHPTPSAGFFYIVAMKKFGPGTEEIIFRANEIEVDATATVLG